MPAAIAQPSIKRGRPDASNTVGSTPASTGVKATEYGGEGSIRQTLLTFTNFTIALTRTSAAITANSGASNPGLVYTFPEGHISIVGAVVSTTLALTTAFATAANFVTSLGTVQAAADATLTGTEANVIASTATAVATSAATVASQSVATFPGNFNGTASAIRLFLNGATSDDTTADSTLTIVSGSLLVTWIHLGDR
jgi:hypothetical protein